MAQVRISVGVNLGTFVPYAGADKSVNLNSQQLLVNGAGNSPLNVAIGLDTFITNLTGVANVAIGNEALKFNTASSNVAVGYIALSLNTVGGNNIAIGDSAMYGNISGSDNIAIGKAALASSNQTGQENTAIGYRAMQNGNNCSYNTVVGTQAMFLQNEGSQNTVVGGFSLYTNSLGVANTSLGYESGALNTTGSANVFIGYYAGKYNATLDSRFYLNNRDQTNTANDIANSLMYGVFGANAAAQLLTINAGTTINGSLTISANNIITDTTTGTKIATATNQKLSFWNKTPIVQPTTGITPAALSTLGGSPISSNDTFGGYTLQQIAAIIINSGMAA